MEDLNAVKGISSRLEMRAPHLTTSSEISPSWPCWRDTLRLGQSLCRRAAWSGGCSTRAGGDRTLVVSAVEVRFAAPPVLDWYLAVHAGLLAPPGAGEALKPVVQRRIARTAERTLPASLWLHVRALVTRAEHAGQVRTFYMDLSGDERQEVIEELRISLEKMRSGRIAA